MNAKKRSRFSTKNVTSFLSRKLLYSRNLKKRFINCWIRGKKFQQQYQSWSSIPMSRGDFEKFSIPEPISDNQLPDYKAIGRSRKKIPTCISLHTNGYPFLGFVANGHIWECASNGGRKDIFLLLRGIIAVKVE